MLGCHSVFTLIEPVQGQVERGKLNRYNDTHCRDATILLGVHDFTLTRGSARVSFMLPDCVVRFLWSRAAHFWIKLRTDEVFGHHLSQAIRAAAEQFELQYAPAFVVKRSRSWKLSLTQHSKDDLQRHDHAVAANSVALLQYRATLVNSWTDLQACSGQSPS